MCPLASEAQVKQSYRLSNDVIQKLTDLRIRNPERAFELAQRRKRRDQLTTDGRLNIIACDHPARRVTNIGPDALAMADRAEYLGRMIRVLSATDAADGIMASQDILEELLLLQDLTSENFLDNKLLIASLNRGGLAGARWEMDDPVTGPTPESAAEWNLDGVKVLLRICDSDPGSLKTIEYSAEAISRSNAVRLPMFLEPLPVDEHFKVIKDAETLAKILGVASALGDSSRYLWLKLPVCESFELIAQSTTLPILLLGGEASGNSQGVLDQIRQTMENSHNVRGVMLGRNALFPVNGDPLAFCRQMHDVIHNR